MSNQQTFTVSSAPDLGKVWRDGLGGINPEIERFKNLGFWECISKEKQALMAYRVDSRYHYPSTSSILINLWDILGEEKILLDKIYYCNSSFMFYEFKNTKISNTKLVKLSDRLSSDLYNYMKGKGDRVSKSLCNSVSKLLTRHASRIIKGKRQYIGLRYRGDRADWNKDTKGITPSLNHNYFSSLIEMLCEDNLLIKVRGQGYKGGHKNRTNMIIFHPSFLDMFEEPLEKEIVYPDYLKHLPQDCVVLRDKNKNPIKPKRKNRMKELIDAMVRYNDHVAKFRIEIGDVAIPEVFFRRIFIEDFESGGRLYCHEVQSRTKFERSQLTIDGEKTVSLDYKSLHVSLIAAQEGWDMKGQDIYTTDLKLVHTQAIVDAYKNSRGLDKYDPVRNICKKAMLILLNTKSRSSAISALATDMVNDLTTGNPSYVGIRYSPSTARKDATRVIDDMINRLEPIKHRLHNDEGLKLQNLDSGMMQHCVEQFITIGSVCLPVHDELIVKESDQEFAISVMEEAYSICAGSALNCVIEKG